MSNDNNTYNLKYILQTITILAIVALVYALFGNKKVKGNTSVHTTDTTITITHSHDTICYLMAENKFYNITKTTVIPPSTKIDTLAILQDYYTQKIGKNNYTDTNVSIDITDTLYRNSVKGRAIAYKLLRPNTIITKTITNNTTNTILKANNGFFVGAGFMPNMGLYPTVSYVRNRWQLGSGLIFSNNQLNTFINFQYKINNK